MAAELVIPPRLAETVVLWEGDAGRVWLDDLPRRVAEVVEAWDLDVGAPFVPGGNISWVAPVRRRADDLDAVLKLQLPHPESDPEAVGLRAWDGDGAVRLYDHDPERCALLIERCTPGAGLREQGGTDVAVAAGAEIGARLHAAADPARPAHAGVGPRLVGGRARSDGSSSPSSTPAWAGSPSTRCGPARARAATGCSCTVT